MYASLNLKITLNYLNEKPRRQINYHGIIYYYSIINFYNDLSVSKKHHASCGGESSSPGLTNIYRPSSQYYHKLCENPNKIFFLKVLFMLKIYNNETKRYQRREEQQQQQQQF